MKTILCTRESIKGSGYNHSGFDKIYVTCPEDWTDEQIEVEVEKARKGRSQPVYFVRVANG